MSAEQNNVAFDSLPEILPELDSPSKELAEGKVQLKNDPESEVPERATWGNQLEFLMSCIAASVGLGNVWRFPFIAYQNGGGAFLIPYLIVLILVGKPMYYLECILGQFSSRNSVKVWSLAPAMKGTGYAQALGCGYILSYYVSIVALCLFYLFMSFQSTLPWAICDEDWTDVQCVPSSQTEGVVDAENARSSAELYFQYGYNIFFFYIIHWGFGFTWTWFWRTVLQLKDSIIGGLGAPVWYLTLCLFASWLIIFLIVARGVKSSGKAAYFLAIFPYVVMVILLISTVILPGAGTGILFFLTPQWDKLVELDVWYAAVTQVFFSLTVCTGPLIMFSSYNNFRQNVYRDAMIVTTLDTFTSLLSGITIFGILGNLAYVLNSDVADVVGNGGTGLAFISYPDAIAKTPVPQLFSVLFFLMMSVLGVGSAVALLSALNAVLLDAFPKVPTMYMSALSCTAGFAAGLTYVTPGGQWILDLVDHFGATFLVLFAAISEIFGVIWIYGLENLCLDIEFMLGTKTSVYWRWCWGIITPFIMIIVFIYGFVSSGELLFDGQLYPTAGYVAGYAMLCIGIFFVPLFMVIIMYKNKTGNLFETIKKAFRVKSSWGPRNSAVKREWQLFKMDAKAQREKLTHSKCKHVGLSLLGSYRK